MRVFQKIYLLVFMGLLVSMPVLADLLPAQQHHISVGGLDRTYLLYRPSGLSKQGPVPLVIILHGGFGSGVQAEHSYNWDAQAAAGGFVVAYPDGIGRSWNAGGTCCGPALRDKVDDVDFISQLIQKIMSSENIDPKKVYLAGISNGAAMSYRYACEGTYPLAAIGSVAGSLSYYCKTSRPISVIEIHGSSDKNIPLNGGLGSKGVTKVQWLPVQRTLDLFREVDNCAPSKIHSSDNLQITSSSCESGRIVKLVTINGAGHQWPGGKSKTRFIDKLLDLDPPSTALNATNTLWKFFQNQHN